MKQFIVVVLTAAVLTACQSNVPEDIIPQGVMTDMLYDYHRASAMAETSGDNNTNEQRYLLIHKVFEKYGVTEAQFDSSMVYYSGHAKSLVKMYEKIDGRLKKEMADLGAVLNNDVYANITSEGDTAMIWQKANLWLSNNARENLQIVKVQPDSTFRLGDTYMLRFSTRFVGNTPRREAFVMLTARFDNDSVSSQSARVAGDRETTLRIQESYLTDHHHLKQFSLTFYLNYESNESMQLWMVDSPILVRFHKEVPVEPEPLSAENDSIAPSDTLDASADTMSLSPSDEERMTPEQMRSQHRGEHNIDVVQKRRVVLPGKRVRRSTSK